MENDKNARRNLKNMFIYAKRDIKLTDMPENTNLLGFSNAEMVFEKKQNQQTTVDNTKKFLVLNGKKFKIVQHREVIKIPKTAATTEPPQKCPEKFKEKMEDYGNGKKKFVITPVNFMAGNKSLEPVKPPPPELLRRNVATQTLPKAPKVDRGTTCEVLTTVTVETQTNFGRNKVERSAQTEPQFNLLEDVWMQYLNDPDLLITGNDPSLNDGFVGRLEEKEPKKGKLIEGEKRGKKLKFHEDLVGCLVWDSGNLPIHKAVIDKDVAMLKRQCVVLKIRQCDVNIRNHQNLTPLHLAILLDADAYVVGVLLQNDAKASLRDSNGNNALHLAVTKNRYDLVEILLDKHGIDNEALLDVDSYNHEGLTPLMLCAFDCDRIDMAEKLLVRGAQPNLRDLKSGRTALFHAAENHNTPIVSLLLDYCADTKIRNFFGTSVHDAMFELDDIPKEIKYPILGRDLKIHQKRKLNLQESSSNSTNVITQMATAAAAMMASNPIPTDVIKRQKLEIVPTFQKIEQNTKFVVNTKKKFRDFSS